jgi:uncharacterized membrane protein (DUF485 family)
MDWDRVEGSEEFHELTATRRRIVAPLLGLFVVWFGGFLVLSAYARGFMAETIYRGFTVAYATALSLVLMTWLIAFIYIRTARSSVDPRIERLDL